MIKRYIFNLAGTLLNVFQIGVARLKVTSVSSVITVNAVKTSNESVYALLAADQLVAKKSDGSKTTRYEWDRILQDDETTSLPLPSNMPSDTNLLAYDSGSSRSHWISNIPSTQISDFDTAVTAIVDAIDSGALTSDEIVELIEDTIGGGSFVSYSGITPTYNDTANTLLLTVDPPVPETFVTQYEVDLDYTMGDASDLIGHFESEWVIMKAEVVVVDSFDGTATLKVGTGATNDLILNTGQTFLLEAPDTYERSPNYTVPVSIDFNWYLVAEGCTIGSLRIILTIREVN